MSLFQINKNYRLYFNPHVRLDILLFTDHMSHTLCLLMIKNDKLSDTHTYFVFVKYLWTVKKSLHFQIQLIQIFTQYFHNLKPKIDIIEFLTILHSIKSPLNLKNQYTEAFFYKHMSFQIINSNTHT